MQPPIRELPHIDVPRPAVCAVGVLVGVISALAVQILLGRNGVELATVWRNLVSAQSLQLQTAGAWWLMAGAAFLASAITAAIVSRAPLPWHQLRLVRWLLGGAVIIGLAEVGHIAASNQPPAGGDHVAISLSALIAAAVISLFAAYFAVKR